MTNDSRKLEIFEQIIQESGLFVNLTDALVYLKDQLIDDDATNVIIIENWIEQLPENDKENILAEYEHYLLNLEMLGNKSKSSTKPGEQSQSLKEILENATVAPDKPPEPKKDTPSS